MTREDRPDTGRDRRIEPRIDWTRIVAAPRARRDHPVPAWRDRRYWRWALLVALLLAATEFDPFAETPGNRGGKSLRFDLPATAERIESRADLQ